MAEVIFDETASVSTPSAGKASVYVDNSANPQMKLKDDAGNVRTELDDNNAVAQIGNKDFASATTTISDVSASSKAVKFSSSGATAATVLTLANAQATSQTLSFPVIRQAETIAVKPQVVTTLSTPLNPTGTSSATVVMMGLSNLNSALIITPQVTGRVLVQINGVIAQSTTADGAIFDIRMGTGTAPANGAAPSGTVYGGQMSMTFLTGVLKVPFSITALVTGLTVGTAYWIDIDLARVTGGTATMTQVCVSAFEL
jgi:hypothetical protein